MKEEPEIVRILKEEEKLGTLNAYSQSTYEKLQMPEKSSDEPEETISSMVCDAGRKIKNTELENLEERYRTIFENSAVAITLTDEKERIISWNKYAETLLGMNKEDLYLKPVKSLYPPEEWKKIRSENVRQKGMQHHLEAKILRKNKKLIDVDLSLSVLKNHEGKVIGSIGVIKDMTERKKIEEALEESEKKFRDIFDATGDFLLYVDTKGTVLDMNDAAINMGGLEREKIIGKPFSTIKSLFSREDMKKHLEAIDKAAHGMKVSDYESDLITKGGVKYRFLFSNDLIKEGEEIKGILVRGRDVTQYQKAWDDLVKLEEKYRILAETSADGVLTIDSLGRLTYVNPSFEKMCGRRKSQILATLFRDYLLDDSVYFFQQIFMDARKMDEKIENVELEIVHADGNIIPIEVNIAPFKRENEFAGMVCTVRDITQRRMMEDELKKSERLKTEFMNIAAHELKSPVTPIKGYLDLIISDIDASEKVKNWAKISLRNSERLLKLVNDILDVSRLDSDTMRFDMEKLNTVEILDEVAEDMKPTITDKNLNFIINIPRNLPSIMGDRNRLSQVLKNLLGNAVKFTDNGSITIGAKKKENHILISVEDTGVGISTDELKKIFNKFYQAYTGDDRNNEGTGLGLFICKEIVEKHKGEIWAESKPGKGSKFVIKIPYIYRMVVDFKK